MAIGIYLQFPSFSFFLIRIHEYLESRASQQKHQIESKKLKERQRVGEWERERRKSERRVSESMQRWICALFGVGYESNKREWRRRDKKPNERRHRGQSKTRLDLWALCFGQSKWNEIDQCCTPALSLPSLSPPSLSLSHIQHLSFIFAFFSSQTKKWNYEINF